MKKLLLYISVIVFAICSNSWGEDQEKCSNKAGKAKSDYSWIWCNSSLFEQIATFKKKTCDCFNETKSWISKKLPISKNS